MSRHCAGLAAGLSRHLTESPHEHSWVLHKVTPAVNPRTSRSPVTHVACRDAVAVFEFELNR
jgi:hypothetical protein